VNLYRSGVTGGRAGSPCAACRSFAKRSAGTANASPSVPSLPSPSASPRGSTTSPASGGQCEAEGASGCGIHGVAPRGACSVGGTVVPRRQRTVCDWSPCGRAPGCNPVAHLVRPEARPRPGNDDPQQFAVIRSDLDRVAAFRGGRGIVGGARAPEPVTLRNYAGTCPFATPPADRADAPLTDTAEGDGVRTGERPIGDPSATTSSGMQPIVAAPQ
jgi:hypothetical protein